MELKYAFDDGGRALSGRRGFAGDCVARALAIMVAAAMPNPDRGAVYDACYAALADEHYHHTGRRSARNGVVHKAWHAVYEQFGLAKAPALRGVKPTYAQAFERNGNCVVVTRGHVCALVDGALRDTFDGREYYWEPTGEVRKRKALSVWVPAKAGA